MSHPEVLVHPTPELLVGAAAARLVTRLVDLQATRGAASIVLTGGRTGIEVLRQLCRLPALDAVDWSQVELWWGDERFLPAGDPDRNETQAREALLDHVPLNPDLVHPMPAAGGDLGDDVEEAAATYAALLARRARPEDHGPTPTFDVCLLGVGEDGHVASVFPGSPAVYETERTVVGVRGAPKPPPNRSTLTLPTIRRATEVWLLTTGEAKAAAVALALGGAGEVAVPAAGAVGIRRTLWVLDRGAAAKLPRDLIPPLM